MCPSTSSPFCSPPCEPCPSPPHAAVSSCLIFGYGHTCASAPVALVGSPPTPSCESTSTTRTRTRPHSPVQVVLPRRLLSRDICPPRRPTPKTFSSPDGLLPILLSSLTTGPPLRIPIGTIGPTLPRTCLDPILRLLQALRATSEARKALTLRLPFTCLPLPSMNRTGQARARPRLLPMAPIPPIVPFRPLRLPIWLGNDLLAKRA